MPTDSNAIIYFSAIATFLKNHPKVARLEISGIKIKKI